MAPLKTQCDLMLPEEQGGEVYLIQVFRWHVSFVLINYILQLALNSSRWYLSCYLPCACPLFSIWAEKKNAVYWAPSRPQLKHSNTYIFTELNWKRLEKLCTEQGWSISNKILLFNFPFLCSMQITSFYVLELAKRKTRILIDIILQVTIGFWLEQIFCSNPYKQAIWHAYVLPWTNIQCRTYFEKLTYIYRGSKAKSGTVLYFTY